MRRIKARFDSAGTCNPGTVRGRDLMGAFDSHRPPGQSVIDDCVHCGFCLETCPTYVLWGAEADSPRGRIVLVNDGLNSEPVLSDEMVTHFDRCLGCMACVTACPSGVRYDRLIERVRPQVERHHRRTPVERGIRRLLYETLPHPRRLRALAPMLAASRRLGLERRLPSRLAAIAKVAPRAPSGRAAKAEVPEHTSAVGPPRGRVGLLLGCVQRVFYSGVHRATVHALAAEGFDVVAPALPDCCGALELHGGAEPGAVRRAQETIRAFAAVGVDRVVVNAAGCGSAMKEYGELLGTPDAREFSARVRDVSELLGAVTPRARRGPVPLRVAYHDACHLAHAQGVRSARRELLRAIPELEVVEVGAERDVCCGSAGIYNLVQPEAAAQLGERKARHLIDTGAQAIAAGNPGCAAQLDLHLRQLGSPAADPPPRRARLPLDHRRRGAGRREAVPQFLPGVHRVDRLRVLLGDRPALEFHGGGQLIAAGQPVAGQDREPLDLLHPGQSLVGGVDPCLNRLDHLRLGRRAPRTCRSPSPLCCAHCGAKSASSTINAVLYGRRSPMQTAWPIRGLPDFSAASMFAGDMFLPAALMMISFLRSMIVRKPSSSIVPMSPVCSHPSASIASAVFSGWLR